MLEKTCRSCGGARENDFIKIIEFQYDGLSVAVSREKEECLNCAKLRWISGYERVIKPISFVVMTPDGIKADWNVYHKLVRERVHDVRVENKVEIANKVLLSLGIITLLEAGTYEVVGTGSIVPSATNKIHNYNPQDWFSDYRFENKQDAIDYATAMIREYKVLTKIKIRMIGNVTILDNSK